MSSKVDESDISSLKLLCHAADSRLSFASRASVISSSKLYSLTDLLRNKDLGVVEALLSSVLSSLLFCILMEHMTHHSISVWIIIEATNLAFLRFVSYVYRLQYTILEHKIACLLRHRSSMKSYWKGRRNHGHHFTISKSRVKSRNTAHWSRSLIVREAEGNWTLLCSTYCLYASY